MANADNKNLHEGHRQRVKERFLKHGIDSFSDIQFLETLLFYAVPKKDTNDTAHLLLNTFGSLKKVFEASYEDLTKVKGIGENAASLIKFFQMGSKRYLQIAYAESVENKYDTPQKLKEYCKRLFLNEKREMIYAIALDCDLAITAYEALNTGHPDSVYLSYRRITEFIYKSNTSRIVLTHNHPNGAELVSRNDVETTRNVAELLDQLAVEFVDHIVVGKNGEATSMKEEDIADDVWRLFRAYQFQ